MRERPFSSDKIADVASLYSLTRTKGFGEEVKKRILLGAYSLSAEYVYRCFRIHRSYWSEARSITTFFKLNESASSSRMTSIELSVMLTY